MRTLTTLAAIAACVAGAAHARAQTSQADARPLDLALWIADASHWRAYTNVERLKLDGSITLEMGVGETKSLLPMVTGAATRSNVYVDVCVPLDGFEVTPSSTWAAVEPEQWDCAQYSAYIAPGDHRAGRSPVAALRFRALGAGAFRFLYRITTAAAPAVAGEFRVTVTDRADAKPSS